MVAGGSVTVLSGPVSPGPPATLANFGGQVAPGTDAVGAVHRRMRADHRQHRGKVARGPRNCTFNVKVKNANIPR